MALDDLENRACVCSWISILGDGPKQNLKDFIVAARAIIESYKAVWLLVNTDWQDILKKEALEVTLALYQSITDPIEAPLNYLVSQTAPFADCPPLATLNNTMRQIANTVLAPVRELEEEINDYIEAIEINQNKSEFFDNLISVLDDIEDAIELC